MRKCGHVRRWRNRPSRRRWRLIPLDRQAYVGRDIRQYCRLRSTSDVLLIRTMRNYMVTVAGRMGVVSLDSAYAPKSKSHWLRERSSPQRDGHAQQARGNGRGKPAEMMLGEFCSMEMTTAAKPSVGSHPEWEAYAIAYKEAADHLVTGAQERLVDEPHLACPIMFLYRHHLELSLSPNPPKG